MLAKLSLIPSFILHPPKQNTDFIKYALENTLPSVGSVPDSRWSMKEIALLNLKLA